MTKTPGVEIAKRKLLILQKLNKDLSAPIDELVSIVGEEFPAKKVDDIIIKADIDRLKKDGFRIHVIEKEARLSPLGLDAIWKKDTDVHVRLIKEPNVKTELANKVVSYIVGQKQRIRKLILGSGTSVGQVGVAILACKNRMEIETVYTGNLIVIYTFILEPHKPIKVEVLHGVLERNSGYLLNVASTESIKHPDGIPVDAVVTSFSGLSLNGFSVKQHYDIAEKKMELFPHKETKCVLIPMDRMKIGWEDKLVLDKGQWKDLDFKGGKANYIIFTEHPQHNESKEDKGKFNKIMAAWEDKGGKVEYINKSIEK